MPKVGMDSVQERKRESQGEESGGKGERERKESETQYTMNSLN